MDYLNEMVDKTKTAEVVLPYANWVTSGSKPEVSKGLQKVTQDSLKSHLNSHDII